MPNIYCVGPEGQDSFLQKGLPLKTQLAKKDAEKNKVEPNSVVDGQLF